MSTALPVMVVDIETTMKSPGKFSASPFWPENYIVAIGQHVLSEYEPDQVKTFTVNKEQTGHGYNLPSLFIGHNLSFDLHYMWRYNWINCVSMGKSQVWDTQLAAYLLTAQTMKFASLDELSVMEGGTVKDDEVKQAFKAGIGAEAVDPAKLTAYLEQDVLNTRRVFMSQFSLAESMNMLPFIWSQMDAKLACAEMTYNGMHVDMKLAREMQTRLTEQVTKIQDACLRFLMVRHHRLTELTPKNIGTVLFGGEVEWVVREQDGHYKNGKQRFKNVTHRAAIPALFSADSHGVQRMKNKQWPTDEKTLLLLQHHCGGASAAWHFIENLLTLRDLQKQLSTYYEAAINLVMPDGCIHHNLNQCVTATGRLSSSDPNLQNITDISKSRIKEVYDSRWGADGYIVEVDYSQLEMVALAILSGDEQLQKDIRDGVDMHTELYKSLFGRPPTKEERRPFKRCSFCLVYGGSAKAISEQSGLSLAEAGEFISKFYTRYPGVKRWHDEMVETIKRNRFSTTAKGAHSGSPLGAAVWVNPITQRRLRFAEYDTDPETMRWKKAPSFSPTEIKNYPVQSFATGDIVPLMLGRVYRVLKNNPLLARNCLMVNTVHDSVEFDCHKDVLHIALPLIKDTMESVRAVVQEVFGVDVGMDFKVEVKYGPNWGKVDEWKPEEPAFKEAA